MRPTALLCVRVIPVSAIPRNEIRLPPNPAPKRDPKSTDSPTIERLLKTVNRPLRAKQAQVAQLAQQLRTGNKEMTLDAAEQAAREQLGVAHDAVVELPPNLRIKEYVPNRAEYAGIKREHRELLKRLRREA
ncbi:anaphase promoting complex subunit 1 [Rhodotorula toruloides]|uniref:Anaphase promoting complex subunit 1 n=1 Tax=Rhodotorula toruloides TaxID=5286 RepID=A0A511KQ96_RHOTO|nr:anaphase promoting complex subunit 1 [Rhodotorula toruloides]